jgi:hypothetical protein
MTQIVKVQLPLFPPDSDEVLIYDRGKKRMTQATCPPEVRKKMGERHKAFFHAQWNADTWIIGDRAPDQSW